MGIIDLDKLYDMDFIFYQKIISTLGRKFSFDITCGLAGNSFAGETINSSIEDTFPLNAKTEKADGKNKAKSLNHVEGLIASGLMSPMDAKELGLL